MERQQYLLGSFYILLVDTLWVLSGYITKAVFNGSANIGDQFKEPFFVTFYGNFLFTINLIAFLPMLWNQCSSAGERNERYSKLDAEVPSAEGSQKNDAEVSFDSAQGVTDQGNRQLSIQSGALRVRLDGETERETCCFCFVVKQSSSNMSIKETFCLGALFCPVWFVMNYLYNMSLMDTFLGDTTSLSTLSGPFCLILSWIFLGERIVLTNIMAVTVMVVGTFLIMKCGNRKTCTVYYWPDSESYAGDLWAILSAFAYACYGILMKVYVGDGTKTSMSLLFGFIGICNLIFLWPLIIFFRFTHIEPIKWPPTTHQWLILTVNGLCSIFSDYFMARAIVLTTPLIVNVGLTLTIPATLLIDVVFNGVDRLLMYYIGVLCLIVGFFVVNIQAARDLKQKKEFLTYAAGIMSTKRLISISDYKVISGIFDEQPADVP